MSGSRTIRPSSEVATPARDSLAKVDGVLDGVMNAMHLLRRHVDDIWFALEESAEGEESVLSGDERLRLGRAAVYKTLQRVLQVERELEAAMDLCAAERGRE